jgi:hypothetical protein
VREADWARRIMHAAARQRSLPKGMNDALMTVHAKHPFPDTPEEIAATAAQVRDPNFRVQVSPKGLHVYNRDGLRLGRALSSCGRSSAGERRLARLLHGRGTCTCRDCAWQLGKRYVQDQPLDWGCAVERAPETLTPGARPGSTTGKIRGAARRPPNETRTLTMNDQIFETVVTTVSPTRRAACGADGRALSGRRVGGADALQAFDHAVQHRGHRPCGAEPGDRHAGVRRLRDRPPRLADVAGRASIPACGWPAALAHVELRLVSHDDDAQRPVLRLARVHEASHAPLHRPEPRAGGGGGRRRAGQPAAACSRRTRSSSEMAYLQIAIDKTAGPGEHEAWGWLQRSSARSTADTRSSSNDDRHDAPAGQRAQMSRRRCSAPPAAPTSST